MSKKKWNMEDWLGLLCGVLLIIVGLILSYGAGFHSVMGR